MGETHSFTYKRQTKESQLIFHHIHIIKEQSKIQNNGTICYCFYKKEQMKQGEIGRY